MVDIRSLRLNKSMLNVLKINEISFGIDIEDGSKVTKLSCNQLARYDRFSPSNETIY